ncbi:Gfo/Idh/MocA family protein [Marinicrinis sediminis]|uniref:Gfo/Idh/MocA family protein n=1 Tax=Marinicrinis sediminis TaxID=1652465 RepID=A0ABW5RF01_9BACL
MNKIKIGMLSFAHMHAFSYFEVLIEREDAEIVGIWDADPSRVKDICDTHQVTFFDRYEDLLETDCDVIIINSENVFHAEHTIAAAKAKKHVMCEKPLGTKVADMEAMIEACKENGVKLMTAFPNRYVPTVVEAKRLIDQGEIGELVAVKGTNKGAMPGGWFVDASLSGGGAMLDHSVHVMDIMNWVIGSPAVEVYAENGTLFYDELNIDDSGMVNVKFANGVIASLDTSWSRIEPYPYKRDLTIEWIGTKGTISIDYFQQINEIYSGEIGHAEWSYWGDNKDDLLVSDLLHVLKTGEDMPITGEDGLHSTRVAIAAYESARTGRVVKI